MAGIRFTARLAFDDGEPGETLPDVLELRVHGVNNTTAHALLDVRPEDVEQIEGDKLGSFWRVKTDAAPAAGRGAIPAGILREAYSWGGMVRTTPDLGAAGVVGTVAGIATRLFYALILPFSIANAVQWTRILNTGKTVTPRAVGSAVTAGLSRIFSLVLTLLLVTSAAVVSLDIGAAQCAMRSADCAPVSGFLDAIATWGTGPRLALFSLAPVLVVVLLWVLSGVATVRYDVLPGMGSPRDGAVHTAGGVAPALSSAGFWSTRVTADLARAHVAAGISVATLMALQFAHAGWGSAVAGADGLMWAAWFLLGLAAVLVAFTPTGTLQAEPTRRSRTAHGCALLALVASGALYTVTAGALVFAQLKPLDEAAVAALAAEAMRTSDATVLALIGAGAAIAVTGLGWRLLRHPLHTAWLSFAPAVLMTVSLALALAVSAIVVVVVRNLIVTKPSDDVPLPGAIEVPPVFLATGSMILLAVGAGILLLGICAALPRRVRNRARAWGRAGVAEEFTVPTGGVLPPSAAVLFDRIEGKRRFAARVHLVEPAIGLFAMLFAAALVLGGWWAAAALADGTSLVRAAVLFAWTPDVSAKAISTFLEVAVPVLAWIGVAVVAMLVSGAATGGQRPLAIVWDVACYLPRTGHPFGPPCYAQRAVPEIAGRTLKWLQHHPERRVVLSAHSMGAVLSVSALGLLASDSTTAGVLPRVSLLTFGVQLRTYFGRMLPDLLGPDVLATAPARGPSLVRPDPWGADYRAQGGTRHAERGPAPAEEFGRIGAPLVGGAHVEWVSLWRLTDYLGFPAVSTTPNAVDRFVEELDTSGYMVEVGTHGEYYRAPGYATALCQLAHLAPLPPPRPPGT